MNEQDYELQYKEFEQEVKEISTEDLEHLLKLNYIFKLVGNIELTKRSIKPKNKWSGITTAKEFLNEQFTRQALRVDK